MNYEAKSTSPITLLRASWFCFKSAVAGWTLFFSSFVVTILQTLSSAVIFYLMATYVIQTGASSARLPSGYGSFIVTGFLGLTLLNTVVRSLYNAVATGYWGSFWEFYGAFPLGVSAYLIGSLAFNLTMAVMSFGVTLLVGVSMFDLSFQPSNLGSLVVVVLASLLPAIGLGLTSASMFFLIDAKGWREPVMWSSEILSALFAGTYFPIDVLPKWLQPLGHYLPHTYALRALRLSLIDGMGLTNPEVASSILSLLAYGALLLPCGCALFRRGLDRADRMGQLTRWV